MLEQRQNFLKGINRRFSREDSSNPEFFYTLQNARIYNRGDTGKIQRINGFSNFVSTGTDYSNILDIIEFQEFYVVLFQDVTTSTTFHIEVFDSDGNSVYSQNYTGEAIDTGKLTNTDDTIFISPHNKVLYYDGSWTLEDFVSEVPTISGQSQGDANAASASIEPTSSVSVTDLSEKATAQLRVIRNNTSYGKEHVFNVSVGGNQTADITIEYGDRNPEVAQKIYNAIDNVTAITDNWNFGFNKDATGAFAFGSSTIYFEAVNAGSARNSDEIKIVNSDFTIVNDDPIDFGDDRGRRDGVGSRGDGPEGRDVRTVDIQQPSGGIDDTTTTVGPLYIRFNNVNNTVITENILDGDSATVVADKIQNGLNNHRTIPHNFTISRSNNVITIESDRPGEKYNGEITLRFFGARNKEASILFSYNKQNFTGGADANNNLTLKPYTDYWYKVRYKYVDGHVSEASFPVKINTGPSQGIDITFDTTDVDLDGANPKLQIFRKEEGQNFFLIDEIDVSGTTTNYTDDGKPIKSGFEDAGLIWSKNHRTQTIVDQRYIRANIDYSSEQYTDVDPDGSDFTISTTSTSNDESMPNDTKARFFIQPQYSDGTKGYFQEIGNIDVQQTGLLPTIDQSTVLTNSDRDIEEVGIFVNYKPHSVEHRFRFNSFELANENIPTINDSAFFPSNPRILFGFKYIEVWNNDHGVIKVAGWDSAGTARGHGGFSIGEIDNTGPIGGRFPQELNINIMGITFKYLRYAYRDADAEGENGIYKLANFEAIKRAVSTGDLKIRLTSTNIGNLSNTRPDSEIIGEEVNVKSIIDRSAQYPDIEIFREENDIIIGPLDSRIYLELESSALNDIDNDNLTKYSYSRDYEDISVPFDTLNGFPKEGADVTSYTMTWEFTNLKKVSEASFNTYTGDGANNDGGRPETGQFGHPLYRYSWDYEEFELTSLNYVDDENTVIFLGRKENEDNQGTPVTIEAAGLEFDEDQELKHAKLQESNIYSTLTTKDEINLEKTSYPNQIIWSNRLRLSSGFSGGRSFGFENFFNISNENGDILDIRPIANKAYIFCERGLAIVNIGEVLATQKQGEIHINSENFMTNYYWISDNLVDVKRGSISQYQNRVFFSDGSDVYTLSNDGIQNISSGIIPLDSSKDYYGSVNPKYNEYQLCDYAESETWVYNFEFQQWYGPFTYKFKDSSYLREQFITVDDSLYEHDIGNTFDGNTYETLIQSVANDTEASFFDKTYRKFYINSNNDGTFKYGKDTSVTESNSLSTLIEKNGYKHQGVAPSESNSKTIFWEIATTQENFELQDIAWRFQAKRRR